MNNARRLVGSDAPILVSLYLQKTNNNSVNESNHQTKQQQRKHNRTLLLLLLLLQLFQSKTV